MVRQGIAFAAMVAALMVFGVSSASAAFGVSAFNAEVRKSDKAGDLETQAGATPKFGVTDFSFNTNGLLTDGNVKDVRVDLPPGLISNPQATPKCTEAQFPNCPANTQLGTEQLTISPGLTISANVYNMVPKQGQVSLFSFNTPVGRTDIVGGIRDTTDYGLFFTISDIPQNANLQRSVLTFFGNPAAENGGGGAPSSFIRLPTSCSGVQTTVLTATSWAGETVVAKSTTPTGATGCDALPFAPKLSATTFAAGAGKPAGLTVKLTQTAAEANVRSVGVTLPSQLGVRLDNLQHACPQATFEADPTKCEAGARVGSTSAKTPLLATPLTGEVYLEAHEVGKLPTLEAILHGPGLRVRLSGTIDLLHGIQSTFASIPDVPISEFVLTLDSGANSALSAKSDLCATPLAFSSSILGQNGAKQDSASVVGVAGCSVKLVSAKAGRYAATFTLRSPAAGKVRLTGKGLVKKTVIVGGAGTRTVKLKLSRAGNRIVKRKGKLVIRVTAKYSPAAGSTVGDQAVKPSSSRKRVSFRRVK
jgi:hypothetical protein